MVMPSNSIVSRMTCWDVRIRRSHPLVSLSDLRCTATTGRESFPFFICVAALLRTPVSAEWSCSAVVVGMNRGVIW